MTIQSYEPSTDFMMAAAVRRADHPWPGATVWMTGLVGSGKVTLAAEMMRLLTGTGRTACVLDSVHFQLGLNTDVGFSRHGHAERVRRIAEVARLFAERGIVAIVADISPYRADRAVAMKIHRRSPVMSFLEVFVEHGHERAGGPQPWSDHGYRRDRHRLRAAGPPSRCPQT